MLVMLLLHGRHYSNYKKTINPVLPTIFKQEKRFEGYP